MLAGVVGEHAVSAPVSIDRVNLRSLALESRKAHGGEGQIRFARVAEAAQVAGPCNFIDYAVVPPGVSIGEHRHQESEEEFYLVLTGSGLMRRGDDSFVVTAGDLIRNPPGEIHGLYNPGPASIELFVFELSVGKSSTILKASSPDHPPTTSSSGRPGP